HILSRNGRGRTRYHVELQPHVPRCVAAGDLVINPGQTGAVQLPHFPSPRKRILPPPTPANFTACLLEIRQKVGGLIGQRSIAPEIYDSKPGILIVDRRNRRLDQHELLVAATGSDYPEVIYVGVTSKAGQDRAPISLKQTVEPRGPLRRPHGHH